MFETASQKGESMAFHWMIDPKEKQTMESFGEVEVGGGSAILAAVWPQNAAVLFLATREVGELGVVSKHSSWRGLRLAMLPWSLGPCTQKP